jgi:hypothetical protein
MTKNRFVIMTGILVCLGIFYLAIRSTIQRLPTVQASHECGPVIDTTFVSPSYTNTAHLMNQYCAPGFGSGDNRYWVAVGDDVAKVGLEGRLESLGPEDHVVFKAWDYEPVIVWQDDDHLVIKVVAVSRIAKSLHTLGGLRVSYKISEALSEENFLRAQNEYEETALADFKSRKSTFVGDPKRDVEVLKDVMATNLKNYRAFQAWARESVE